MAWTREGLQTKFVAFYEEHKIPVQFDRKDGKYYIYMNMKDEERELKISVDVKASAYIVDAVMPVRVPNMQMMQKIYYLINKINAYSEFGCVSVSDVGQITLHYAVDMTDREATEDVLADALAFPSYTSEKIVKAIEPVVEYDADPDKVFNKVYGSVLQG
jgi:hypothetical protein